MKQLAICIIKKIHLYTPLLNSVRKHRAKKEIREWESKGKPVPPPHVIKQHTLKDYAEEFGLKILVETGTYQGQMIDALKNNFSQLYSIELSKELYDTAKEKFQNIGHIQLIHGDSGVELEQLVKTLNQPALFWLDGHYSAGVTAKGEKSTPIYEELEHIFNTQERHHIIIIDDARCFGRDAGYPSIQELSEFIQSKRPDTNIKVENDMIRITPKK